MYVNNSVFYKVGFEPWRIKQCYLRGDVYSNVCQTFLCPRLQIKLFLSTAGAMYLMRQLLTLFNTICHHLSDSAQRVIMIDGLIDPSPCTFASQ